MDDFRSLIRFHQSETLADLGVALQRFISTYGYDKYVLASVSPVKSALLDRIYLVGGDWVSDGAGVDANDYLIHCPITRNILDADDAFFWSKTVSKAGERYRVVSRPTGAGIHGIQIPVFGRLGLTGAASFVGVAIDSSPAAKMAMTMAGTVAYQCAHRLSQFGTKPAGNALSLREREVLGWISAGRRQSDVAASLGLSERTIENHLRRIRQRLGVATTAEAVRVAVQLGYIKS